ncbi:hypothetical protein EP7_005302 [Isosphaeraceae bacterium EP7]
MSSSSIGLRAAAICLVLSSVAVTALGKDHHKPVPVPPALEIEVLDPNADPVGNPAVETIPGPDGRMLVDIPRLVLVHRYYYTGDRSFQFRIIPGGPAILVVNHPRTSERLYIETTLPPGAPRVIYRYDSIEYDYGSQGVKLTFGKHGGSKIAYRQGSRTTPEERRAEREVKLATKPTEPRRRFGESFRNAGTAASDGVHNLGRAVTQPIAGALKATPLGNLRRNPEREAINAREALGAEAGRESALENASIDSDL